MRKTDAVCLTVKQLTELPIPEDYLLVFVCPDGYEDSITDQFVIDDEDKVVRFLPYNTGSRFQT